MISDMSELIKKFKQAGKREATTCSCTCNLQLVAVVGTNNVKRLV